MAERRTSRTTTPAPEPSTWFLPAERAPAAALAEQVRGAAQNPVVDAVLRTWAGAIAVINPQRQIVALNAGYLTAAGVQDPAQLLGLRPGEAIGCDQAAVQPGG
jgi:hypothetical protein